MKNCIDKEEKSQKIPKLISRRTKNENLSASVARRLQLNVEFLG